MIPWWHPCLTMELQFGHTTTRQVTWRMSKTEPTDFFWKLGENTSWQQLRTHVLDAHQAKTSVADIVILALHN